MSKDLLDIAQCYKYGINGYEKSKTKAFELLKTIAEDGDPVAQYELGNYYEYDLCDSWDIHEDNLKPAFEWYKKSAEQGHEKAQCCLAEFYESGQGCEKNLELAFKWYQKCADQGDGYSQYNLATFYETGKGCEKNLELAFKWYKESSEGASVRRRDSVDALIECYKHGIGCEKNLVEAVRLYKRNYIDSDDYSSDGGYVSDGTTYSGILDRQQTEETITALIKTVDVLEEINKKQETELEAAKRKIAELEITCPIEGGSEYQEAKRRFDEYKKNK